MQTHGKLVVTHGLTLVWPTGTGLLCTSQHFLFLIQSHFLESCGSIREFCLIIKIKWMYHLKWVWKRPEKLRMTQKLDLAVWAYLNFLILNFNL